MPEQAWNVKGITKELRRRFKAEAAIRGLTIGRALVEAMEQWLKGGSNENQ